MHDPVSFREQQSIPEVVRLSSEAVAVIHNHLAILLLS